MTLLAGGRTPFVRSRPKVLELDHPGRLGQIPTTEGR